MILVILFGKFKVKTKIINIICMNIFTSIKYIWCIQINPNPQYYNYPLISNEKRRTSSILVFFKYKIYSMNCLKQIKKKS